MSRGQLDPVIRHLRQLAGAPPAQEQTDAELVRRFVAHRDEAAFTALAARHGRLIRAVCRRVLGRDEEVEDAVQATLLVLARRANSIRKGNSVASWLFGVAFRIAMNAKKAACRRRVYEQQAASRSPEQPLFEAALRELQTILDEEVHRLPEKYRAPFVLCCLEGKNKPEAARELGWKEGTVSGRLAQARERLRQRLARRGVALSAALSALGLSESMATAALPAATIRNVLLFTSGKAVTVSSSVATLAEGVLKPTLITKLQVGGVCLLSLGLMAAGTGLALYQPPTSKELTAPRQESKAEAKTHEKNRQEAPASVRLDQFGDPLPEGAIARIGTLRLVHGSGLTALAYAPDGKTLASCGYGSIIRLWDTATGKEVRQYQGPNDAAFALAFSPDGKLLAAGGRADLWVFELDKPATQSPRRLPVADAGAGAIAFSPNGKLFASVGLDQIIHVWEVAGWKEVQQIAGPGKGQFCVTGGLAFLADNNTILCSGSDKVIRLWDVTSGKEVRILTKKTDLRAIAHSPDGKYLASCEGIADTVNIWEPLTGRVIRYFKGAQHSCACVAFSADGQLVACAGMNTPVLVWDTNTGNERFHWNGPEYVSHMAFSADGKTLAVGHRGMIRFREVATGKDAVPLSRLAAGIVGLAFTPTGDTLVTASLDGTVGLWESTTGKQRRPITSSPSGQELLGRIVPNTLLAPDAKLVASLDCQGVIYLWDRETGKELRRFADPPADDGGFALSSDGQVLAATHKDKTLRLWDTASGRMLHRISPDKEPWAHSFSGDGKILATRTSDSSIQLWDTRTGKELRRLRAPSEHVGQVTLSPDGKLVAAAQFPGKSIHMSTWSIFIWEVKTGKMVRQLGPCSAFLLRFSPDGRTLAAGSGAGDIEIWELINGQVRQRFQGHRRYVFALAFSPDDHLLASGAYDHTAVVWDLTGISRSGRLPVIHLRPEEIEQFWNHLAGEDRVHQTIWSLAAAPRQSVPFLTRRLQPVLPVGNERIAKLIAQLDDEQFKVREEAASELEGLGELAEPLLRKTLAGKPSLEVRRRVEALLVKIEGPVTSPETLRKLRAIEVLEHAGTAEAKKVLETLAQGAPESRLTQEAKASLERLAKRPLAEIRSP